MSSYHLQQQHIGESFASSYSLPSGEVVIALLLAVPCLTYVFSLPYVLYHGYEPITNGTTNNNSKLQELRFMDRTVFTDFAFEPGERTGKEEMVQVIFIVSAAFGGLLASILSDIHGRKIICDAFIALTILSGFLLQQVATSFITFCILWSALSFGLMGSYTVTFIRLLELLPDRLRLPAGLMFFGGSWNLSRFAATLFAVAFRDWAAMVFFLSLWLCAVVVIARVHPNSMRQVPFRAAEKEDRFYHIVTKPRKLAQLLVLSISWLICGLIFFGFNLSRNGFFSDSMHANLLLPGLIDFLALVLATVTCYSTRRTLAVFMVFMLFNALCLLAMVPIQTWNGSSVNGDWIPCEDWTKLLIVLTQVSSLFTGGANWSILWLITASTFPTRMR